MAYSRTSSVSVDAKKKMRTIEHYQSFLGIFGSWRTVSQECIDDDLHIDIYEPEQYDKIYVNGQAVEIIN